MSNAINLSYSRLRLCLCKFYLYYEQQANDLTFPSLKHVVSLTWLYGVEDTSTNTICVFSVQPNVDSRTASMLRSPLAVYEMRRVW